MPATQGDESLSIAEPFGAAYKHNPQMVVARHQRQHAIDIRGVRPGVIPLTSVSVLMANYNKERFIVDAVQSVLNQTLADFELIIVDDESTDGSLAIVKNFQKTDARVRVLTNAKNAGTAASLNKAMKVASGQYFCLIDSDDLFKRERLEKMVEGLGGRSDCIAFTDIFRIDEAGETIKKSYLGTERLPPEGDAYGYLLRNWIWGLSTMMFPASAIQKIGYIDETFTWGLDLDFVLRLAEKYRVVLVPEALYGYRAHDDSMTSLTSSKSKGEAYCKILDSNLKRRWSDLDETTRYRTIRRIQNFARDSDIQWRYISWWVNPTFMRIAAKRLVRRTLLSRPEPSSSA